jgi:hypothetical protein
MGLLRSCSRLTAIAVIVAAGLAVAACDSGAGGSNASGSGTASSSTSSSNIAAIGPRPTTTYDSAQATVIGQSTGVVVNSGVSAALKQASVTVTAVAPATARTTLLFPVSSGQILVATLAGTLDHTGGLAFSHSGKSVILTNFVINTNTKQLTATVGGHSMPIFDLNLASLKRADGPHGTVVASNIKLVVTTEAATALNSGLGVSTFKAGTHFGTATLTIATARGHR